ncbi:hypothetical protein QTI66_36090 [Variovorax sp. J22R133]|uniref:hypothetical protein n=1 Tax=Variovorax brevis TaxID=3053503 RepID=UPI002578199D|nr:hypothetical protein [Variovorax sp. J22R133]MDM0117536.1 hypothetical protein [Variovorax sp. J22R133]
MQLQKLAMGVVLAGLAATCWGYQTDFHFGMTYWLGIQAGLTPEESEYLASGNEWKDAGMLDARPVVAYNICLRNDPGGFDLTRKHHFRSQHAFPALPRKREVTVDSAFGVEDVTLEIRKAQPAMKGSDDAFNQLFAFGGVLHGFQDLYSHQGETQVPWGCGYTMAWAHPVARNRDAGLKPNWLSSAADLTSNWPDDCLAAALATYNHIRTFTSKVFPDRDQPEEWSAHQTSEVKTFCALSTKSEKVDWLKGKVPYEQSVMDSSNLENGKGSYSPKLWRTLPLRNYATAGAPQERINLEAELDKLAKKVTKANLTPEQRFVVEKYLQGLAKGPARAILDFLGPLLGRPAVESDPIVQATLRMRFIDRGLAAKLPLPVDLLNQADNDLGAIADGQNAEWRSFYVRPRGQSDEPYLVSNSNGEIVVYALLRHAPNELVRAYFKTPAKTTVLAGVDTIAVH